MALREITVKLPEELVRDAEEFGVLDDAIMTEMVTAEVERRVNAMVNDEIHTYRAEKRPRQSQSDK